MTIRTGIEGGVDVTFEFLRHLGPRYIHGGVTLSFDANLPYAFISTAVWPSTENYEATIQEAVEQVLIERLGGLDKVRVQLKQIAWNDISSCAAGFNRAARAATREAFDV
jgi:hypothetical protein